MLLNVRTVNIFITSIHFAADAAVDIAVAWGGGCIFLVPAIHFQVVIKTVIERELFISRDM